MVFPNFCCQYQLIDINTWQCYYRYYFFSVLSWSGMSLVIWDNSSNATIPVKPTLSLTLSMIATVIFPLRSVTFPRCNQNHSQSLGITTKNAPFSTVMSTINSDEAAKRSRTDSTRRMTSQLVKCVVVIGSTFYSIVRTCTCLSHFVVTPQRY